MSRRQVFEAPCRTTLAATKPEPPSSPSDVGAASQTRPSSAQPANPLPPRRVVTRQARSPFFTLSKGRGRTCPELAEGFRRTRRKSVRGPRVYQAAAPTRSWSAGPESPAGRVEPPPGTQAAPPLSPSPKEEAEPALSLSKGGRPESIDIPTSHACNAGNEIIAGTRQPRPPTKGRGRT